MSVSRSQPAREDTSSLATSQDLKSQLQKPSNVKVISSHASPRSKSQDRILTQQERPPVMLSSDDFTKVIKKINEIIENQKQHDEMLQEIMTQIRHQRLVDDEAPVPNISLIEKLPASEIEGLQEISDIFSENDNTYQQLVKDLMRIGGYNFKEMTRRLCSRVLNDNLSQKLSFKGHKGKTSFSNYKICDVIIEAVMKSKNVTEKEVETFIAIWLSKATERLKKSKKTNDDN